MGRLERDHNLHRLRRHATRHFLVCQVYSWNGELVTSVYVHFALQGKSLYFETAVCALAPCKDEYRIVDDIRSVDQVPYLRYGWQGFLRAPAIAVRAPFRLIAAGTRSLARAAARSSSERACQSRAVPSDPQLRIVLPSAEKPAS